MGYVEMNWQAFAVEPWAILAFWQGGLAVWPGVAAAAVTLLVLLKASRAAAAGVATLAILALVWASVDEIALRPAPIPLPQGLQLVALDGRVYALESLKGQPLVVNLWATWCPPCRRELPMLIDVARASPVPVLLANQAKRQVSLSPFSNSRISSAKLFGSMSAVTSASRQGRRPCRQRYSSTPTAR